MEYIIDNEKAYLEEILKSLRAYNDSQTGKLKKEEKHIYILRNKKLVGATSIHLGWDWVGFGKLFFDNKEVLETIVSTICDLYREEAVGIHMYTNNEERLSLFEEIGFVVEGSDKSYEEDQLFYSTAFTDWEFSYSSDYEVIIKEEKILEFDKILDEHELEFKRHNNIKDKNDELIIVALDKGKFAGGVHGVIYEHHMYINLLVVETEYRGCQVGSILMKDMEKHARSLNLKSINLGTAKFQAKEFYQKLGYEVTITQKNYPKGFECYSLNKKL